MINLYKLPVGGDVIDLNAVQGIYMHEPYSEDGQSHGWQVRVESTAANTMIIPCPEGRWQATALRDILFRAIKDR